MWESVVIGGLKELLALQLVLLVLNLARPAVELGTARGVEVRASHRRGASPCSRVPRGGQQKDVLPPCQDELEKTKSPHWA